MIKEIDYELCILDGMLETIEVEDIMTKMGFPENYTELIDL